MGVTAEDNGSSSLFTFSEVFFELSESLCSRYTALTPFSIRRETFEDVISLIEKISRKQTTNNNNVIYKKATNDDWY